MEGNSGAEEYKSYGYRWVVLLVFGLILATQAFLWISYAPIGSSVEEVLGVNEILVRLLALVGPVMFVFLGSYAGDLSDRRGFKFAVSLGAIIISVAGIFRAIVPHLGLAGSAQYWILLVLQAVIGAGAVFILVNMSKMPIKWFKEEKRASTIGLATMFFFLGIAIGLPLVTVVASIPEKTRDVAVMSAGMNRVLTVFAIVMAAATVVFIVLARENPPTPSGPVPEEVKFGTIEALRRFMRSGTFRSLCLVSMIGYGVYLGMTVTMEKIIGFHGFSTSFAAIVAALITVGGIMGSAVIPYLSERVGLRKPFLIFAAAASLPCGFLIAYIANKPLNLVIALWLGFCLLPALPITFAIVGEMEEIGPLFAGAAVGTVMAAGNIGSLIIPVGMALFKTGTAERPDYRISVIFMAAVGLIALLAVILWVRETGPRKKGNE
jgi:MFS family permease